MMLRGQDVSALAINATYGGILRVGDGNGGLDPAVLIAVSDQLGRDSPLRISQQGVELTSALAFQTGQAGPTPPLGIGAASGILRLAAGGQDGIHVQPPGQLGLLAPAGAETTHLVATERVRILDTADIAFAVDAPTQPHSRIHHVDTPTLSEIRIDEGGRTGLAVTSLGPRGLIARSGLTVPDDQVLDTGLTQADRVRSPVVEIGQKTSTSGFAALRIVGGALRLDSPTLELRPQTAAPDYTPIQALLADLTAQGEGRITIPHLVVTESIDLPSGRSDFTEIPAGSEAEPSLRFAGDLDTGWYFGGQGIWRFSADAADVLVLRERHVALVGYGEPADAGVLIGPSQARSGFHTYTAPGVAGPPQHSLQVTPAGSRLGVLLDEHVWLATDGTASAPALGWRGTGTTRPPVPGLGIYRTTSDSRDGLHLVAGGQHLISAYEAAPSGTPPQGVVITGQTDVDGVLRVNSGSAADPSLAFRFADRTGLYRPAGEDAVAISTAGTQALLAEPPSGGEGATVTVPRLVVTEHADIPGGLDGLTRIPVGTRDTPSMRFAGSADGWSGALDGAGSTGWELSRRVPGSVINVPVLTVLTQPSGGARPSVQVRPAADFVSQSWLQQPGGEGLRFNSQAAEVDSDVPITLPAGGGPNAHGLRFRTTGATMRVYAHDDAPPAQVTGIGVAIGGVRVWGVTSNRETARIEMSGIANIRTSASGTRNNPEISIVDATSGWWRPGQDMIELVIGREQALLAAPSPTGPLVTIPRLRVTESADIPGTGDVPDPTHIPGQYEDDPAIRFRGDSGGWYERRDTDDSGLEWVLSDGGDPAAERAALHEFGFRTDGRAYIRGTPTDRYLRFRGILSSAGGQSGAVHRIEGDSDVLGVFVGSTEAEHAEHERKIAQLCRVRDVLALPARLDAIEAELDALEAQHG